MNEFFSMQQILGGFGGRGWLPVAYLVCLFGVLVFRPDRITNIPLFKAAYYLFALSYALPSTMVFFAGSLMSGGRGQFSGQNYSLQLLSASGPALFGLSLVCGLGALIPGFIPPTISRPSQSGDDKPPLDT